MSDNTHSWQDYSVEDWNNFLKQLHQNAINKKTIALKDKGLVFEPDSLGPPKTIEQLFGKNTPPQTITDWLIVILFSQSYHDHLLNDATNRRKIFHLPGQIALPEQLIGNEGQQFIKSAATQFQAGAWGPPLSNDTVMSLQDALIAMNEDITSAIAQTDIFEKHKDLIIKLYLNNDSNVTMQRKFCFKPQAVAQALEQFQQDVIIAYRQFVIEKTIFLQREPGEDSRSFKLRSFRVIAYLSLINQHCDAKEATESIISQLQEDFFNEIKHSILIVKQKAIAGEGLYTLLHILKHQLETHQQSNYYLYLGEKRSEKLLHSLRLLLDDYHAINHKIESHLQSIAEQFVPSFDQDVKLRIVTLLQQAQQGIQKMPAFKRRKEVGKQALAKSIVSDAAIQRVHQAALKARVAYFKKMIPGEMAVLCGDDKEGLPWIISPRARREVIAELFHFVEKDLNHFRKPHWFKRLFGVRISKEKNAVLAQLQLCQLDAYEEDIAISKGKALEFIRAQMNNDKLLTPLVKSSFYNAQYKNKLSQSILNLQREIDSKESAPLPMSATTEGLIANLFTKTSLPEQDVTLGLLQSLAEGRVAFDEFQEADLLLTEASLNPSVLLQYINDPAHHDLLKKALERQADPIERITILDDVFTCLLDGKTLKLRFLQLPNKNQFTPNQQKAITLLQDIKLKALVQAWHQCARDYGHCSGDIGLPEHLTQIQKNNIYMTLLYPAKKSPLFNCEVYPGNIEKMQSYLRYMTDILHAMPEQQH